MNKILFLSKVALMAAVIAVVAYFNLPVDSPADPVGSSVRESGSGGEVPVPTLSPSSIPSFAPGEPVGIKTVNESRDFYAGKELSVYGRIYIVIDYSRAPCNDDSMCVEVMSRHLYIGEPGAHYQNNIPIYKNGQPYPCVQEGEVVSCSPYVDGGVGVIAGTFIKTKVAGKTIVTSSGKTEVVEWLDFYYLEVK